MKINKEFIIDDLRLENLGDHIALEPTLSETSILDKEGVNKLIEVLKEWVGDDL